jgi:hypothetical protein
MEDKKKVGLIVTIVTVLLCGCPGLCALVFGAMMAAGRNLEQYGWEVEGNPAAVGIPAICVGIIFVLIPIAAGVYTLMQNKKAAEVEKVDVPPAL